MSNQLTHSARPSGPALVASLKDGIASLSGNVTDYGVLSTPQLHYITRCLNTADTPDSYGVPTEEGYYQKLSTAFNQIVSGKTPLSTIYIDAANGVGALKMKDIGNYLADSVKFDLVNGDTESRGKLNFKVGPLITSFSLCGGEGVVNSIFRI